MSEARRTISHLAVLLTRDLREFARDRVTLILALVAPVLAALIASAGLGSPPDIDARVVVAGSPSDLAEVGSLLDRAVARGGASQSPLHVTLVPDEAQAREAVRNGDAVAALIIPGGSTTPDTPVTVVLNRNARLVGDLTISAARTIAGQQRLVETAELSGVAAAPISDRVLPTERRPLNAGELYGPVMAVFFLFLSSGFVARSLAAERERGTLERMRAVPINTGTIVAAKTLTMLVVAAAEFTAVLAAMRIAYGARWGNTLAVAAIAGALAFAVAALAVMIASFARTHQSSAALVAFTAMIFAVLGGSLVPLRSLPEFMRGIAGATPNGIAIFALHDIAANGSEISDIARPLFVILIFATVVGGLGLVRLRHTIEAGK